MRGKPVFWALKVAVEWAVEIRLTKLSGGPLDVSQLPRHKQNNHGLVSSREENLFHGGSFLPQEFVWRDENREVGDRDCTPFPNPPFVQRFFPPPSPL